MNDLNYVRCVRVRSGLSCRRVPAPRWLSRLYTSTTFSHFRQNEEQLLASSDAIRHYGQSDSGNSMASSIACG
eukprot:scaffold24238_cov72-Phaeocystis_antarctica.AAC.1